MHESLLLVQLGEVPIKCSFVQKDCICTTAYSKCKNTTLSHMSSVAVLYSLGLHHVDLALKYNMWELKSFLFFFKCRLLSGDLLEYLICF